MICLQETLLVDPDQNTLSSLGWSSEDSLIYLNASCRSGGIPLAWKETFFALQAECRGRHLVAACLMNRADGRYYVFASAYNPSISIARGELWEDLIQMCETFPSHPVLIGGDFKVTLAAEDRPNGMGGRDLGSVQFRDTLFRLDLVAIGPSNHRFTWGGPASQSRIERFLCSPALIDVFPLAVVTSLPRPLSDHSPLA